MDVVPDTPSHRGRKRDRSGHRHGSPLKRSRRDRSNSRHRGRSVSRSPRRDRRRDRSPLRRRSRSSRRSASPRRQLSPRWSRSPVPERREKMDWVKNFTLPQSESIVSHPEKREPKKGGEAMTLAHFKSFLDQVNAGTWSSDQRHTESEAILKGFEAGGPPKEEDDLVRLDYTSKQVEDLRKKYQTIAKEVGSFMVEQGQWGTYTEDTPDLNLPTHLLSEDEEQLTGVPMSIKSCSHIDKLLSSKEDLKPSRAGGLARVWPRHYRQYCHYRTSMTDGEVRAVWAKDQKQVKKLIDRDAARKTSMEAAVNRVRLAEDAIKNGTVVETISGVINTASYLAKKGESSLSEMHS